MKKFIYPQELDEVDYREMHDGQIRVYKNGRIFRTNKWGETIEAPQYDFSKDGTIYQESQKVKVPKEITERLLEALEHERGDKHWKNLKPLKKLYGLYW